MRQHPLDTPKPRRRKKTDWLLIAGWAAGIVIAALLIWWVVAYFSSIRTIEGCEVDMRERTVDVRSSTNDGKTTTTTSQKKLVYTSCGVFTVDDNFFLFKFNSADTYGSLHEEETFDLEVIGWRNGLLSWFPNVLSATPSE